MSLRRLLPPCLLAAVLAALSVAALAAPPDRRASQPVPAQVMPTQIPRAHDDDSLSDSVRRVERSSRGQVLSAERIPFDGRNVNRIKTVDDQGRVRVFMDDPQSGRPPQRDAPHRDPP